MAETKTEIKTCYHCGEPAGNHPLIFDDKHFCCSGCKTVYQVLNNNGLCEYYNLNNAPGQNRKVEVRPGKFAFLEDSSIANQLISFKDGTLARLTFYLPQIHCSSCLWLLEHLGQLNNGIISSRVDFAHKEAVIHFDETKISLKKVAELLTEIGYEPHISLNELGRKPRKYYNRARLYRLGVAGFCLGNIMLLAFPEYLSIADDPEQLRLTPWFRYLNLALALPVFFYSAQEFFIQGWKGLRKGFLNIDAPIALAILITFGRSVYEVVSQTGGGYFDSMAGIVFFMLIGRVLQDKTQQSLTFDRDYTSYFPVAVNKLVDEKEVPVALPELKSGDRVIIHNHEIIPADGMLLKGQASIDYSFVTGESVPVSKEISELIYAGGRQMGGKIELLLVKDVSQSYLTGLWNKASQGSHDDESKSFLHPLARYFTIILFTLTAAAATYWWFNDPTKIWPVVTAMLIVACPCALLLSATFTNGHIVRALDKAGMYLKNYSVLEKLLPVTHIVFDKTGTITTNNQFDISYSGDELTEEEKILVASVATQSSHPLSKAVRKWLQVTEVHISDFKEFPGKGIEAWQNDRFVKMGSLEFVWGNNPLKVKGSVVAFRIDHEKQGMFILRNNYRPGLKEELKKLSGLYKVSLISGDNDAEYETLSEITGNNATLKFNQSPHDKLSHVKALQKNGAVVLMVGDGLNDAAALSQSDAGIAVSDNVNNFSPACDAIMEASKLQNLHAYLKMAKRGRQVIYFSFFISVIYNIVGLWFASMGLLTPLVAAILMPASSISILIITWLGVWISAMRLLHAKKV
ncbi:MAG: heavy metal translocating P-type ATPase metal-binding domain-containing protein [Chitinophagaceae bacterium]|nr:heavy metal translocating P-type ATPase metal-binding domain-containing protein [Chitinophagaceae bacterium]